MKIDSFNGEHRFLSNFYPSKVKLSDGDYASIEHAYQAAKTTPDKREAFRRPGVTASEAKKLGRHVPMHPDWEEVKVGIMHSLLRQKFRLGSPLAAKLLATGDAELEEGNYWGDTFWGVCRGKGENQLGRLLMLVRDELKHPQEPFQ